MPGVLGLINTMVFTHIPSNLLLILVPLMPSLPLAITVLLLRFSISQMDVPTRQSYTMGVVAPHERSAAAGVTTIARSLGAGIAPTITGFLLASPALINFPFFLAGSIKISSMMCCSTEALWGTSRQRSAACKFKVPQPDVCGTFFYEKK